MSEQHRPGRRPEHDDSVNPTTAAPDDQWGRGREDDDWGASGSETWGSGRDTGSGAGGHSGGEAGGGGTGAGGRRGWSTSDASANAQQFLGQLQAMIDNLARQSAPVVREIGAKAAELAAIAAERAGPLAERAAERTQEVGARVAERSRGLAEELRRQEGRSDASGTGGTGARDPGERAEEDTTAPSGPTV